MVNSPDRRKAKKPRQQAAYNMMLSYAIGGFDQTSCNCKRMAVVIGRRGLR